MAYYDALIAKWPSFTGTTAQKLAQVNALTVAGPNGNVPVSAVVAKLMLTQVYLTFLAFSQGATNGNTTHDNALGAAKMLVAMINTPNAPVFMMSDSATYASVNGMLDALLAQETAAPGTVGVTQSVHDALLSLCATTMPWWQSNGYPRAFDLGDCAAAGVS